MTLVRYVGQRFITGVTNTATDSGVRSITFSNPVPVQKVWRAGTLYSGGLSVPFGYSIPTWQIINHTTQAVVASGTSTVVSATLSFLGTDHNNTYTLLVTTTRPGWPDIARVFPGEMTCLPPVFDSSTADLVLDLSAAFPQHGFAAINNINGGWTDRGTTARYKVYVSGAYTGASAVNFFYWMSSNPANPVHFIFANASTTASLAQNFRFGESQNIIIDGCTSESTPYGFISNTSVGENLYFTVADNTHQSSNWIVGGLKAINSVITSTGGGGFIIQSIGNSTINDGNYRFSQGTFFNCYVQNANAEGFYLFHTTDNDSPAWSKGTNMLFYNLYSSGANNENFQIGGTINSEAFKCYWLNGGNSTDPNQQNNTVYKYGNVNLSVYMNTSISTHNLIQINPGITGTLTQTFSNVYRITGTSNVNVLLSVQQLTSGLDTTTLFYNNTVLVNTLPPFELYNDTNAPTTTRSFMYADGNVVCSDTTTQTQINNGYVTTNTIMNNLAYANTTTAKFKNVGANDFHLLDLTSPLLGFSRNSTVSAAKTHWLANYDNEGYKYITGNLTAGAYSATELLCGPIL